jgi:hypothetical protein
LACTHGRVASLLQVEDEALAVWNFIWTDPVFEASHAQALVGDIVARVRQAVA